MASETCPECGSPLSEPWYDEETNQTIWYCTSKNCAYVITEGGDQT